jgi:hypothetical protein
MKGLEIDHQYIILHEQLDDPSDIDPLSDITDEVLHSSSTSLAGILLEEKI